MLGITVVLFAMINLMPGDPIDMMINPEIGASGEALEARRIALGLDKPLPVRYFIWLGEACTGNLGYSYVNGQPVLERISQRISPTLQLMGFSLLIAIFLGIVVGVFTSLRQYSFLDYLTTTITLAGVSIPSFFIGLGAIYIFSLKLDLLPVSGMHTLGLEPTLPDRLKHLILPSLVLAFGQCAEIARYVRSEMLGVMQEQYIVAARAKGLPERIVIYKHALRNGLLPVITLVGLSLPNLIGGAVITEQIFRWPGMGTLMIEAVLSRDYPVLMGVTLVLALAVFIGSLIADVLYAVIDPRIRL